MPLQLRRRTAMGESAGLDAQFEVLRRLDRSMPLEASSQFGDEVIGAGKGRVYRGSWAEQRVVARLATNRTRKATRITTTPPTVNRSQRSELPRATTSCFPVITIALTSNSTALTNDCSDQDHRQTPCPSSAQRRAQRMRNFPYLFQERRIV